MISLRVCGTPAPQGSKRHVGNGILIESSKKVGPWREAVISEIQRSGYRDYRFDGAVDISALFLFQRPKSHYRTGKNAELLKDDAPMYVARTPDLDKILRSTWDALTQSGIIRDDALIVSVKASKIWCGLGEPEGAHIVVRDAK